MREGSRMSDKPSDLGQFDEAGNLKLSWPVHNFLAY